MAVNTRAEQPEVGKETIALDKKMEPFRIGVIKPIHMEWNQFAFDEAHERGLLRRPVELIPREAQVARLVQLGAPNDRAAQGLRATSPMIVARSSLCSSSIMSWPPGKMRASVR